MAKNIVNLIIAQEDLIIAVDLMEAVSIAGTIDFITTL